MDPYEDLYVLKMSNQITSVDESIELKGGHPAGEKVGVMHVARKEKNRDGSESEDVPELNRSSASSKGRRHRLRRSSEITEDLSDNVINLSEDLSNLEASVEHCNAFAKKREKPEASNESSKNTAHDLDLTLKKQKTEKQSEVDQIESLQDTGEKKNALAKVNDFKVPKKKDKKAENKNPQYHSLAARAYEEVFGESINKGAQKTVIKAQKKVEPVDPAKKRQKRAVIESDSDSGDDVMHTALKENAKKEKSKSGSPIKKKIPESGEVTLEESNKAQAASASGTGAGAQKTVIKAQKKVEPVDPAKKQYGFGWGPKPRKRFANWQNNFAVALAGAKQPPPGSRATNQSQPSGQFPAKDRATHFNQQHIEPTSQDNAHVDGRSPPPSQNFSCPPAKISGPPAFAPRATRGNQGRF